jgi:ABC-type transport system involved in multi-copper enzyme maturation permease subunit
VGIGLFKARSLVRRELSAYFLSPIAYVMLVVFLLVTGFRFFKTMQLLGAHGPDGTEYPMQYMFSILPPGIERLPLERLTPELLSSAAFWLVYLLIPPLLTMRLFAEERSSGTLEMLMTSPLRDWQLVLAKYLACLCFYVLLWVPTLVYLPVLLGWLPPNLNPAWTPWSITMLAGLGLFLIGIVLLLPSLGTTGRIVSLVLLLGGAVAGGLGAWMHYTRESPHLWEIPVRIDPMQVLSAYLGLFLAGAMFLALGLLVSSLVRSQMVAALVTLMLSLVFVVAGFWRPDVDTSNTAYQVIYFFSVPLHYSRDFSRGLIDTRHVVLYLSVAVFCLFLTVRSLESRRWS